MRNSTGTCKWQPLSLTRLFSSMVLPKVDYALPEWYTPVGSEIPPIEKPYVSLNTANTLSMALSNEVHVGIPAVTSHPSTISSAASNSTPKR